MKPYGVSLYKLHIYIYIYIYIYVCVCVCVCVCVNYLFLLYIYGVLGWIWTHFKSDFLRKSESEDLAPSLNREFYTLNRNFLFSEL